MKKKLRKRFFMAMMLAAVVAVTFTACSGNAKKASSNNTGNEYVYQSVFQNININIDDISNICMKDGRIYMLGKKQAENKKNESEGKQYQYLISFGTDGSDLQQVELEGLEDREYASVFTVDDQKQFRLLTQKSDDNKKTGEDRQYYIHTLNEKGSITDTIELRKEKSKFEDEDFSFYSNSTVFHDGRLYAAVHSEIYTFDEKGEAGRIYKNDNNIDSLVQFADGKIYVYEYNGYKYELKEFEPETGKFGTAVDFGEYSFDNADIHAGEESKIYINDRENVYTFDLSNGRIEKEFNWLNSDIDGNCMIGYVPLEDGKFLAVSKSDGSSTGNAIELIIMSKVKALDIKEKEILRLSTTSLDSDMKSRILSFNKTNEKYRIEVKEYSAYDDAAERLSLDIATGNVPDILDVSHGISTEQFIKKGLFADLYPFMEKDEEIKKEKFVPSVLRTLENDGKLYYMPVSFSIRGLIAGKKMVGDREGWSVEEMIKAYHELPEDGIFMQYITKLWFVQNIIRYQIKDYINWSTGEVNFNSDDFIKLIEVSGDFLDKEENSDHSQESMSVLVKNGKLLLNSLYLDEVSGIEVYTRLYKKLYEKQGGYTILSYPSSDKNNKLSMTLDGYTLAITNQCNHKEGAWEFIRQFLSYDYQKSMGKWSGFPTRQDVLDKKLEYARAEKAYTDNDGTKVQPIHSTYTCDGYQMKLGPVSEEEIELFRSIIDRIGICPSYDTATEEIGHIIAEEMEAFFSGDKSAKETAEVIQGRVEIYVSENS